MAAFEISRDLFDWPELGRSATVDYGRRPGATLDLSLFRNLQCVVDVDAEIPDGALQLAMLQQQLDDSQILGAAVDQRRLGPPHRVRTVCSWIKPDALHPPTNDSCVLASGQVPGLAQAAGEEVIV